jgi:hypothetical protein
MQNNIKQKQSTGLSIFFSFLLLIIILIIIAIQMTILYYYGQTSNNGRCVYRTENGDCECKYTNMSSCNSLNGLFQPNLKCEDGITVACTAIKSKHE